MQALKTWRTASNKRDAVALVTELNSESTYLERLWGGGTDRSTDESVVGQVLPTRLACVRRIAAAGWKATRFARELRALLERFCKAPLPKPRNSSKTLNRGPVS
jgi:hypothetical protein